MTETPERHLAELNLGRLSHPIGSPEIAEFEAALERVNAIAERMPGFEWRLKDDSSGGATDIPVDPQDPLVIANLSVWSSVQAFETFVWKTVHAQFYNRRAEWFTRQERAGFVMWWVEPGHRPTLAEALERLEELRAHGPSGRVFGWEALPSASIWRQARCA